MFQLSVAAAGASTPFRAIQFVECLPRSSLGQAYSAVVLFALGNLVFQNAVIAQRHEFALVALRITLAKGCVHTCCNIGCSWFSSAYSKSHTRQPLLLKDGNALMLSTCLTVLLCKQHVSRATQIAWQHSSSVSTVQRTSDWSYS